MDTKPILDPSPLPPLPLSAESSSPPHKPSRKRKLSSYSDHQYSDDAADVDPNDMGDAGRGSSRKPRTTGTKRACNQCRQQKLKCNVVESPWKDCDRCQKHGLRCEITADFKRVGKRSQQAELEKTNLELGRKVEELQRKLAQYRSEPDAADVEHYRTYLRPHLPDRTQLPGSGAPSTIHQDDDSHDAVLLLNLKQGNDLAATRANSVGPQKRLGDVYLNGEILSKLWDEYFKNYHSFLSVLDPEKDRLDSVFDGSEVLFWTVIIIASRHFEEDNRLLSRLTPAYLELIKDTICKPPQNHYVVKALCLLCTWPLPVHSTSSDMTFVFSGVMMKFAMQLGLHRPSHPMDFSRTQIQLRDEDINDRLQTWVICNLVAQNVSTGYGQPPETVYDATLNTPLHASTEPYGIYQHLHARLEIEKLADKVTQTVYSPQHHASSVFESVSFNTRASTLSRDLQQLETSTNLSDPLNRLYANAVRLHLHLYVFFDEYNSRIYQLQLEELYLSTKSFINAAFQCGIDLRYAPNYILQMMIASAVALLKLLNSFFANYVDRDAGESLFWSTIESIRHMSVKSNDLPQRLAEVFAQMWNADAARTEAALATNDKAKNGEVDASLSLKRRCRMSMSHVFDSVWRWKEELQGKVRGEKLEAAVKNPTSPQSTTHRASFSNGRRPSMLDESNDLPGMTSFSSFGGISLGASTDLMFATSYEAFDPVTWYLDGFPGTSGLDWPS